MAGQKCGERLIFCIVKSSSSLQSFPYYASNLGSKAAFIQHLFIDQVVAWTSFAGRSGGPSSLRSSSEGILRVLAVSNGAFRCGRRSSAA